MNREQIFAYLLSRNTLHLFAVLCALAALFLWMRIQLVENQTLAYQILEEQGRFGLFKLLNGLKYLSIPFGYAFKLSIPAFLLWTGAFMFGYRITFAQMYKIALLAEFPFLLAAFLKVVWLLIVPDDITIWDIKAFYPLSLMHLFDISQLPDAWVHPLQSVNLFEPVSWWMMVYGIHYTARKQLDYAYAIVFTTYVPAFLGWLVYYTLVYH